MRCLAVLALLIVPAGPVLAQDSTKELLGKAQSQSDTKAVEDLIGKLQARSSPAKPADASAAKTGKETEGLPKPDLPAKSKAPETAGKDAGISKEASGGAVKPEKEIEPAQAEQMPSVDLEVGFEYNSARISPTAFATLTTLGRALGDPRLAGNSFLIAGHTDGKGGAAYNLQLSQQRAEAVRQFLAQNFAIDAQRLVAKGFGQRHLKDPANPLAAVNRRVQVVNFTRPERP
jgi:outer membrane protein OmpA-like peptidoglycan-associated protein